MNVKVKLENRTIEIEKLPLRKFSELLKAIQKLPTQLNVLSGVPTEEVLTKLPLVISESMEDVFAVLKIATDITDEELNKVGLNETVDLFIGVLDANELEAIYKKIKKTVARFQTVEEGKLVKTGSTS